MAYLCQLKLCYNTERSTTEWHLSVRVYEQHKVCTVHVSSSCFPYVRIHGTNYTSDITRSTRTQAFGSRFLGSISISSTFFSSQTQSLGDDPLCASIKSERRFALSTSVPFRMSSLDNELPDFRRIVTSHDAHGRGNIQSDSIVAREVLP